MPGSVNRGAAAPTPPTSFQDVRSNLTVAGGAPVGTLQFLNRGNLNPGTSLLGASIAIGVATALAVLDGADVAAQISCLPAGASLIRLPSNLPMAPMQFQAGQYSPGVDEVRVGFRVRRSAIGGNCGHNSGLVFGFDQQDCNAIPAPPLMRNGCFGIVGDSAGGWAFVSALGGVELVNQVLVWPVATNLYASAELRFRPPTQTQNGAVEVWIGGARQLSYVIGSVQLPLPAAPGGNIGVNVAVWHLVQGAVAPDLFISSIWGSVNAA